MSRTVCFFARVRDLDVLERFEFYAQDIRILRELGFDVRIAIRPSQLRSADLYFVWWWTWAFFPVLMAKALRRPALITGVFDSWAFDERPALHRQVMKFALAHANANVFASQVEHREVPEKLKVNGAFYVPLTVDMDTYRPGETLREDFILTVAYLQRGNAVRKCVPEVIKAAHIVHRDHPQVRFVIAGEKGTDYPALRALVGELDAGAYIDFPGAISTSEKIDGMQRCKLYLAPTHFEGFGLATLEAMSCGAPVISSPVGAVPEVVGDVGLLVDGSSPEAIAAAVHRYLEDDELRGEAGRRGRRRAETEFPYARRKQELGEIISRLLEKA